MTARPAGGERSAARAVSAPLADAEALTTGAYLGVPDAFARLRLSMGPAGVVVGRDRHGAPVVLRLFDRRPVHAVLLGPGAPAALLLWRVLATGAHADVRTNRPEAWRVLRERTPADRLRFPAPGEPAGQPGQAARPDRPLVEVADGVAPGPGPAQPWSARVVVAAGVAAVAGPLRAADVVLVSRLAPDEAARAAAALDLDQPSTELLQRLDEDMFAVIGGGADRYVWLSPTPAERDLAGPAVTG
ncbi:hypothetical protein KZZ52_27870 [Dactylosporangium sp. AC04546]|uniref:hypothetical protein n=1 Tax=Dactylosporangium sp. AC04546 TaxID=2862460 RepID=UPI001EDF3718|nr:hypothetical protein [Dactylosporangium sp. AC04546]WVK89085.1 hypothetical protein KZZ52_27870 [Dactylosporangium sp. AC04546]